MPGKIIPLPVAKASAKLQGELEAAIAKALWEILYEPLLPTLIAAAGRTLRVANAPESALLKAIRSGRIVYVAPNFKGKLNAAISRELRQLGAEWVPTQAGFRLPVADLPFEIVRVIDYADTAFQAHVRKLDAALANISREEITQSPEFAKIFDEMVLHNDAGLDKTLKSITVAPKLTQGEKLRLQVEYRDNMTLDIKTFVDRETKALRDVVTKHTFSGGRYEALIDSIKQSYGVSQSKAKFLALQESHLLLAKMQEMRCQKAGVDEYIWRCVIASKLHPVRPMHKALDGTHQRFSDPPVTSKNGDRNNPMQDFRCRCTAQPLLRI